MPPTVPSLGLEVACTTFELVVCVHSPYEALLVLDVASADLLVVDSQSIQLSDEVLSTGFDPSPESSHLADVVVTAATDFEVVHSPIKLVVVASTPLLLLVDQSPQ